MPKVTSFDFRVRDADGGLVIRTRRRNGALSAVEAFQCAPGGEIGAEVMRVYLPEEIAALAPVVRRLERAADTGATLIAASYWLERLNAARQRELIERDHKYS